MTTILRVRLALATLVLALSVTACSPSHPLQMPLTLLGNIGLASDSQVPSIDLLTADPRVHRLYVPHESRDTLEIIDTESDKLIGRVLGLPGIKGIALTQDPNIVFTSNGADATVGVVDVAQRKILRLIHVGGGPDAILYDPVYDLVVDSLSGAKAVSIIDRSTYVVKSVFDLPAPPEQMALDPSTGRVYVSIADKDEVVLIDPSIPAILTTYRGCGLNGPMGIAYDPDQGRLFVGDKAAKLTVVDVLLDTCLGVIDTGHGKDQISFNPNTHHVYTANAGSKNVSVIDTRTLNPIGVIGTGPGAHTIAADSTTDKVFVAVERADMVAVFHDP
jgi:YVTN family beta-propeller protein